MCKDLLPAHDESRLDAGGSNGATVVHARPYIWKVGRPGRARAGVPSGWMRTRMRERINSNSTEIEHENNNTETETETEAEIKCKYGFN